MGKDVPNSLTSQLILLQIISVDAMPLASATHREAVNLISSRLRMMLRSTVPAASMTLEVVSTGVIPVKEKRGDPVTWMQVGFEFCYMQKLQSFQAVNYVI